MRTLSVSETLGRKHHHRDVPTPGTKIRAVFDLFYPPLTIVSIYAMRAALTGDRPGKYIEHLKDFYGLDIRRHHFAHYWLVGEYFPKGYLDYADESYKELAK